MELLNNLIEDLEINNPTYHSAPSIAINPVIATVSKALNRNPCWFAKPIQNSIGVQFDIRKIKETKKELKSLF